MNGKQKGFIEAFKAWDGEAMGDAVIAIVRELLGGQDLGAATRSDLRWECRELLDSAEGHPGIGTSWVVPEGPFQLSMTVGAVWSRGEDDAARPEKIRLEIRLRAGWRPDVEQRWNEAGYISDDFHFDRAEIHAPSAFKGEPGYKTWEERGRPDIGKPSCSLRALEMDTYAHALAVEDGEVGDWLARYLAGEREQVWTELGALGAGVRAREVLPGAMAVVRETMRRCRHNIELLARRLPELGYKFENPFERYLEERDELSETIAKEARAEADRYVVFGPPEPDIGFRIAKLEREVGALPLSICAWYDMVGSVGFLGAHADWTGDWPRDSDVLPDPLYVEHPRHVFSECNAAWHRHRAELFLSPDDFHKQNISGGPAYGVGLPNAAIDAKLENERHHTTFVDYLRLSFRWGGFPGYGRLRDSAFKKKWLPLLSEGLLEI